MILTCIQCALVSVNRNTFCEPPYGPESAMPKNCLLMLTLQSGCAAAVGAAVALAMPSRPAAPAATATATATAAPRRTALPRVNDMRMNSPLPFPVAERDRIPVHLDLLIPRRYPLRAGDVTPSGQATLPPPGRYCLLY